MQTSQAPHHQKTGNMFYIAQIFLRGVATAAAVAAAVLILTSKQTAVVYGLTVDAKYSYSSAFKFFAIANLIACGLSALSLLLVIILMIGGDGHNTRAATNPNIFFYMFGHDLIVTMLLMGGCGAATAIGYVGRYGDTHTGWMPICDHFGSFCHRVTVSVICSYLCLLLYLCLTIISADRSRHIHPQL